MKKERKQTKRGRRGNRKRKRSGLNEEKIGSKTILTEATILGEAKDIESTKEVSEHCRR